MELNAALSWDSKISSKAFFLKFNRENIRFPIIPFWWAGRPASPALATPGNLVLAFPSSLRRVASTPPFWDLCMVFSNNQFISNHLPLCLIMMKLEAIPI